MKIILIKLSIFLLLVGLEGCTNIREVSESNKPYIVLAENQNYCDGIPVFEIYYDGEYKSEPHRFTLFQLNENGKLVFETYLSRDSGLNSSYLCLEKKLLKTALIFIAYGGEKCGGNIYEFRLNDFNAVSKSKKTFLYVNKDDGCS